MKKKYAEIKKCTAFLMAISMATGMMPANAAMAVKGTQIASDNTYTKSAHVVNNPEDENEWTEYDVEVALKVEDGKFAEITVTPDSTYNTENDSYFNKAVSKSKGIRTMLEGQEATEDTINGWDTVSGATCTSKAVKAAALEAIQGAPEKEEKPVNPVEPDDPAKPEEPDDPAKPEEPDDPAKPEEPDNPADPEPSETVYVMMNIPYADFYEAEIEKNADAVDVVSSCTTGKGPRFSNIYYEQTDSGVTIKGVTAPVSMSKEIYQELKDKVSSSVADYYISSVLEEVPAAYKELTYQDGVYDFSAMNGKTTDCTDTAEFSTSTAWGDYLLELSEKMTPADVYGVYVTTTDGTGYGMRHLENIWSPGSYYELAWSSGIKTTEPHGNTLNPEHYVSIMGKTIDSVTWICTDGKHVVDVEDVYVPIKLAATVSVDDAKAPEGTTKVTFSEALPSEYNAVYKVEGLEIKVENDEMSYSGAAPGQYTLVVSDADGKYADLSASFEIKTDKMPATYDAESLSLKKADDATDEELTAYIKNITAVKVGEKSYNASGKRSVKIIKEDGSIDLNAKSGDTAIFGETGTYTLTVTAAGYQELTFEMKIEYMYALMNIPYAEFYKADVKNEVAVDIFSSATKSKTRTGTLAGGSYHTNADGSAIDGITFPVKMLAAVDLSAYKQVADDDSVEITVTNRGQTSTTTYAGQEALFENESYAYYILSEVPAYYKTVTVNEDGTLSFGAVTGKAETLENVADDFTTETGYGDYQLDLEIPEDKLAVGTDKVYAVIVSTKEGSSYGMRHLENIWRGTELAWCTGFTEKVHNCPTSSAHYEAMMGQTINKVTYYTSKGIYEIPVSDIYVPVKFEGSVEVADADISAGFTTVTVTGLPEDFDAEYTVEGLEMAVADGIMTYTDAKQGKYTLAVNDKSGKYAPLSADFILKTKDMPAAYNGNDEAPALVAAKGYEADALAAYLKAISSVSVNGISYAASGRGSVAIINTEDGTINLDAKSGDTAIFAEDVQYEIVVSSTGYYDLTFIMNDSAATEIDTSELKAAIQKAEALSEEDYTAESWSAMQTKLAEAKEELAAPRSQAAVDEATAHLNAAVEALEKADTPSVPIQPVTPSFPNLIRPIQNFVKFIHNIFAHFWPGFGF